MCLRSNVTTKAEWKSVREAGGTAAEAAKFTGSSVGKVLVFSAADQTCREQVPGVDDGSALLLSPSSSLS